MEYDFFTQHCSQSLPVARTMFYAECPYPVLVSDITNQLRTPILLGPVIASKNHSTHKTPNSQQRLTIVGITTRNKS